MEHTFVHCRFYNNGYSPVKDQVPSVWFLVIAASPPIEYCHYKLLNSNNTKILMGLLDFKKKKKKNYTKQDAPLENLGLSRVLLNEEFFTVMILAHALIGAV